MASTYSYAANRDDDSRPNIIFLITDDQQRYTFNFLTEGAEKNLTPAIDQLAAEGTIMMGQHVVSPVCTPSRFSSLTGLYASRARNEIFLRNTQQTGGQTVVAWNSFITPGDKTVAHYLRDAGYATGFVGKNHVVEAAGFDKIPYLSDAEDPAIEVRLKANAERIRAALKEAGFDYAASLYQKNLTHNGPKQLAVHNMDWVAKGGLDFIAQNHSKPFFLYLGTTLPHGPMRADRSWNADPRATAEGILEQPLRVLPPRETIPKRLKAAGLERDSHRQMMVAIDDGVAALRVSLEKYGIDDNTIIFYFNDHGQGAKGTLYRGGTENPSVIWRKEGFPAGSRVDALVSNIDFTPTILDFAGIKAPEGSFDGVSMVPVLEGKTERLRDSLYFEMGYTRAVKVGDWKLLALHYPERAANMSAATREMELERFNANRLEYDKAPVNDDPTKPFSHVTLIPGGGGAEHASTGQYAAYYDSLQLYNLRDDPGEQSNLAYDPESRGKLEELRAELEKYIDDLPGDFAIEGSVQKNQK